MVFDFKQYIKEESRDKRVVKTVDQFYQPKVIVTEVNPKEYFSIIKENYTIYYTAPFVLQRDYSFCVETVNSGLSHVNNSDDKIDSKRKLYKLVRYMNKINESEFMVMLHNDSFSIEILNKPNYIPEPKKLTKSFW